MKMEKNCGYWLVDDEYYTNKVNAIIAAQHRGLGPEAISFHYNDEWWDQANWGVEPTESLQDLYVQRARQLREKYETLILRFSGGADSYNILRTFVDNDIKIDVVAMNEWHMDGIEPRLCTTNVEKKLLARPLLDKVIAQGAKFEVITNDYSPTFAQAIGNDPAWIFDIDAPKFSCIDITACRALTTPEFAKWDSPTTGVIVGVDKPKVYFKEGKIWYFSQPDLLHTMHTPVNKMIPEPFYWTADMPKITIKQCHVVKNYWRNHMDQLAGPIGGVQAITGKTRLVPLIYPEYYGDLDPHAEKLTYWDHDSMNQKYANGNITAPRGWGWDWQLHKSPYFKTWEAGINLADRLIERQFKNKDSIWENGLKTLHTKPRWIGK
jgi:hypothetical protein